MKKGIMENNFEDKMENLNTPNTDFVKHQENFENWNDEVPRKSARIGIIFILIPMVLISFSLFKNQIT